MTKKLIFYFAIASIFLACASTPISDENMEEPVSFKDPAFFNCVLLTVGKGKRDITKEDMAGVLKLSCVMKKVESIEGVRFLKNLKELNLSDNYIEDITELRTLSKMLRVNLSLNKIKDVSPLAALVSIKSLNLHENYIKELAPLDGLINLNILIADNNCIKDFSSLSGRFPDLLKSDQSDENCTLTKDEKAVRNKDIKYELLSPKTEVERDGSLLQMEKHVHRNRIGDDVEVR